MRPTLLTRTMLPTNAMRYSLRYRAAHAVTAPQPHTSPRRLLSSQTSSATWQSLKIQSNLYNYLTDTLHLHTPTPIQRAAIPHLTRRPFNAPQYPDVIIHDITGHGKTLTYLLPILSNIDQYSNTLQSIIIAPTRELVTQIYRVTDELTKKCQPKRKHNHSMHRHVRVQLAVGQVNPAMLAQLNCIDQYTSTDYANEDYDSAAAQADKIDKHDKSANKDLIRHDRTEDYVYRPHILIGTPDTLADLLLDRALFDLHTVKYIVCDEVDAVVSSDQNGKRSIAPLLHIKQFTASRDSQQSGTDTTQPHGKSVADVVLDGQLIEHAPEYGRAQLVLVSATITQQVKQLIDTHLTDAQYITANQDDASAASRQPTVSPRVPDNIRHYYIVTDSKQQTLNALTSWISSDFTTYFTAQQHAANATHPQRGQRSAVAPGESTNSSVLLGGAHASVDSSKQTTAVFFNKRYSITHDITDALTERGKTVAMLTDNSSRSERRDALKLNRANVVLATDLLSRGLDVKTLTHVVNYDVPATLTQYIHRAGRVGRLGMVHSRCAYVVTVVDGGQRDVQVAKLHKFMKECGVERDIQELIIHNGGLHVKRNGKLVAVRLVPKMAQPTVSTQRPQPVVYQQAGNPQPARQQTLQHA